MCSASINRFEWVKLVMQAEGLTPTAKNVACALGLQFANDETGQVNPSQDTLADYLKVHRDTIKRVMRELRNAGWLMVIGSGGRSKAPMLRFLTPGKVVPFRPGKGGANRPREQEERGDDMCEKGGQITPSHKRQEQSSEQRARAHDPAPPDRPFANHRFVGNATDGPRLVPMSDHASLNPWDSWLRERGLPRLCEMPHLIRRDDRSEFFALPYRKPPSGGTAEAEAIDYFRQMIDQEGARHAAQ